MPPQNLNENIQREEFVKNVKEIILNILTLMAVLFLISFIVLICIDIWENPTYDKPIPYDITVVTDATLTQFEYVKDKDTLYYNLALNVTISNLVFGYDYIEGGALYHDVMFDSSILKPLNGSITKLGVVFEGHRSEFSLDSKKTLETNNEMMSGVYHISLNLCLRLRNADYHDMKLRPTIHCDLHVPLKSHKEVGRFHATKCDLRFRDDGICSIV